MYVVHYTNDGHDFFLRNTVFTLLHRATRFETADEAEKALLNASKFMKKAVFKAARVVKEENIQFASDESKNYHLAA